MLYGSCCWKRESVGRISPGGPRRAQPVFGDHVTPQLLSGAGSLGPQSCHGNEQGVDHGQVGQPTGNGGNSKLRLSSAGQQDVVGEF